ncbi:hypothetical protein Tco_0051566 [Tanacetum coccineum]
MPYPVTQGTTKRDDVKREHLYSASANEVDEKKPELKNLPQHLEYAYLHRDKSLPIIISSKFLFIVTDGGSVHQITVNIMHANSEKTILPLPFIDQMLERLCGNEYYCFLDGFSGFFQIPIAPEDQEKTTFTCPYGTFIYRRILLGLCNDLHFLIDADWQSSSTGGRLYAKVFMDDSRYLIPGAITLSLFTTADSREEGAELEVTGFDKAFDLPTLGITVDLGKGVTEYSFGLEEEGGFLKIYCFEN